ncbi:hypothetical protein E4U43_001671 [Claviceps pusilla]|uniref:Uncharacterized protein n=1 Tax=Claviceps pusilla TaxID=123648 RepID=A0A9P7N9U3_9HYPO|nr:hypothetical protein E4U43_001671 [Claviceps pusilla]
MHDSTDMAMPCILVRGSAHRVAMHEYCMYICSIEHSSKPSPRPPKQHKHNDYMQVPIFAPELSQQRRLLTSRATKHKNASLTLPRLHVLRRRRRSVPCYEWIEGVGMEERDAARRDVVVMKPESPRER